MLLEPLTIGETAKILETTTDAPKCILAQRATGGLPAAVHLLKGLPGDQKFPPGARDVPGSADPARSDANPWRERLHATRAPDDLPLDRSCRELYDELVTTDSGTMPIGRSPAGNTITRLITARWLTANPFAMPDPDLRGIIERAYEKELPPLSRRSDVAALHNAARLAADPLH